jgi:hypothetical protein
MGSPATLAGWGPAAHRHATPCRRSALSCLARAWLPHAAHGGGTPACCLTRPWAVAAAADSSRGLGRTRRTRGQAAARRRYTGSAAVCGRSGSCVAGVFMYFSRAETAAEVSVSCQAQRTHLSGILRQMHSSSASHDCQITLFKPSHQLCLLLSPSHGGRFDSPLFVRRAAPPQTPSRIVRLHLWSCA